MNRPPESSAPEAAREQAKAFCAKILEAEAQEQVEDAIRMWGEALALADTDFKRAYVHGSMASLFTLQNHFEEAIAQLTEGYSLAEKIPWEEWVFSFAVNLGNLYSHLARFREAEKYFRLALGASGVPPGHPTWIGLMQNLGAALIDAGKYREAREVFGECFVKIGEEGDPLERAIADLHLARVHNALGQVAESSRFLEGARGLLEAHHFENLEPYLQLNEGRFELVQGRFGPAFRILEEAAGGFEAIGDLAGKVEVLLTLSAPLLEHNLFKEAQDLIEQLVAWEGLVKFPALQHAIGLRRLALGAFSGKWVQEDIQLLLQGAQEVGRFEDWLQFWFHLSLAAARIRQDELRDTFLNLAKALADGVYRTLDEAERRSFLLRPDIARLWRLSGRGLPAAGAAPAVKARRALPSTDKAEAASVAPPVKGK